MLAENEGKWYALLIEGANGLMDKCKIIIVFTALLIIIIGNTFLVTHSPQLEFIEEIEYSNSPVDSYNIKYFFIKDEDYNGFYDGLKVLSYFVPEYDLSKLDTNKYTYIVSVNREIESVKYSGLKCKRRTFVFFPDEYQAEIECSENKHDGMLRIYKMKKINIDYDYHDDNFINYD